MTDVVKRQSTELASEDVLNVDLVLRQLESIQRLMADAMKEGEDYGVLPGMSQDNRRPNEPPRKSLRQPGADKILMLFRLRPEYEFLRSVEEPTRINYMIRCRLYHIHTGVLWSEGIGAASSLERKYANQSTAKLCPRCQQPAITASKKENEKGWFCWSKKGGCGANFNVGDPSIENQAGVQVEGLVYDLLNTLVKMAQKRAKVAAALTVSGASSIFTQDLDEEFDDEPRQQRGQGQQPQQRAQSAQAQPQQQSNVQDGGEKTPGPVAAAKNGGVDISKLWATIEGERAKAGISSQQLFQIITDKTKKRSPSDMTVEDGQIVVDELRRLQEQRGEAGA